MNSDSFSQRQLDAEARLRAQMQPRAGKEPRLEERLRTACRLRHYSHRTEDAYWMWARQFILFHGRPHPREMGGAEAGRAPASAMPAWD